MFHLSEGLYVSSKGRPGDFKFIAWTIIFARYALVRPGMGEQGHRWRRFAFQDLSREACQEDRYLDCQ